MFGPANGKILSDIIERHVLIVANGTRKCTGKITRQRNTTRRTEKSCIDLLIFSTDLESNFESLVVDEARTHVLTRIVNTKKGVMKKESDHNVLIAKFNCIIEGLENKKKHEVYNLKNIECQKKFYEYTSNKRMLSSVFDAQEDLNLLTHRFIKKLDGCIKMCFKKVRLSNTKETEEEKLYNKLAMLKLKDDDESKEAVANVIEDIAKAAEAKYTKVMEELSKMKPDEGKIDAQKFWKIKKKLCPKSREPPSAMLDKGGNLLTTEKAIQDRALEAYMERLKPNKIEKHLESYEEAANTLCEERLKLTELNKTDPWSMDDLDQAVKDLDNNKARDALDYANELFKEGVAGKDLKLALLKLMNLMKAKHQYPKALEHCNITSLYKHKGSHKDFNNYRGVFRVTVFRSILDRLIYNDNYHIVNENLTDGNVGARKQRNIRDNIFVLGAVSNSVVHGKEEAIQVQVQDAVKCFDKLWLQETTNALFEAGLQSDMLNLLYLENKRAKVAIKVNGNITSRVSLTNVEMQGSVWGSLKCTTSMDQLNKIILPQKELTYNYKEDENIEIGVLGMVDDNLSISKCGINSLQKNSVINSFIETQRLTLSEEKSVVLHIAKKKCKLRCPRLKVHKNIMKTVDSVRYLGDVVSASGSMRPCLEDRCKKGWGKVAEIAGFLAEMPNIRKIEVGLKLREAKLHNGILFNSEAWSNVADTDMEKLEVVDRAALRALIGGQKGGGHSKCPKAFYYLEFGVMMVKHMVMIRRLMYHHHILSREDCELIKKIYLKQKETACKGDWILLLRKDFSLLGEDIQDEIITHTPKDLYKKWVKTKVRNAAFKEYLTLKEDSRKKLNNLHYEELIIQPYLASSQFSLDEKQLLYSLRSKCYPAKMNFKKLNKGNLGCRFLCDSEETQNHIFDDCGPIRARIRNSFPVHVNLNNIFGSIQDQIEVIKYLSEIDNVRKQMIEDILPGGFLARTPVNT